MKQPKTVLIHVPQWVAAVLVRLGYGKYSTVGKRKEAK